MTSSNRTDSPRKRTDDQGRAYAGSQLQLQLWVNRRRDDLSGRVLNAFGLRDRVSSVTWLSPLERDHFREYRDHAFLTQIGHGGAISALREFWPSRGPVWDGLATIARRGRQREAVFLVEAKSYPEEVYGRGCQAALGSGQRRKIEAALGQTAEWLGVSGTDAWMGRLYQSANRLAMLFFLRKVLGVEAYLINVCFSNDPRRRTSQRRWREAYRTIQQELGLADSKAPWVRTIVVPAGPREALLQPPASRGLVIVGIDEFDRVVCLPHEDALRHASIQRALREAKTWGDFRRVVLPDVVHEVEASLLDRGTFLDDEGEPVVPDDDTAFDADEVWPGMQEGDFPSWPTETMLDWLPASVRELGTQVDTMLNGSHLEIEAEQLDEVISVLRQEGYDVRRDDEMLQTVC